MVFLRLRRPLISAEAHRADEREGGQSSAAAHGRRDVVEDLWACLEGYARRRRSGAGALFQLLTSREFQVAVAEPAMDGTLGEDELATPVAADRIGRRSGRSAFGANWRQVLAELLERDEISQALNAAPVIWSSAGLARALRRSNGTIRPERAGDVRRLLELICRGMAVQGCAQASACSGRDVWAVDDNFWVDFRLHEDVAQESGYCRVDFALVSTSRNPLGTLYLRYSDGEYVDGAVSIVPRGRTRYSAFLCARGLKSLRWKIDDEAAEIILTGLTARPVALSEVEARLFDVTGERGVHRFAALADLIAKPEAPRHAALTLSRMLTRELGGHISVVRDYGGWVRRHELSGREAESIRREALGALKTKPQFTLLVTVRVHDLDMLTSTVTSLLDQVYPCWKLRLLPMEADAVDGLRAMIEAPHADRRLSVATAPMHSEDIAQSLNRELDTIVGEWLLRISPGDLLASHALLSFAQLLDRCPSAAVVYSDEDEIGSDHKRRNPIFKPEYSPEYLIATNYVGRPTVLSTMLVRAVGGWRGDFEGCEDYDLLLRVIERADASSIRHIPEVLHHARNAEKSAVERIEPLLRSRSVRAVTDHLARKSAAAAVELLPHGERRVRYALPTRLPTVSLIIPTRDKANLLRSCVDSILSKTTYQNFELVIVDNGSVEDDAVRLLDELSARPRVRILQYREEFNFSAINNYALALSDGEICGLVNNDIEVVTPDWLEELVSWAIRDAIGCVGAKLYFPDGVVQHAGVVLGVGGVAAHSHKYAPAGDRGYMARLAVHQNVSAVTGACLFAKRSLFDRVGGLDEQLTVAFNDVDFCMKVAALGYRNVFTPFAELIHHESRSRGIDDSPEKLHRFFSEYRLMLSRWGDKLYRDPYYSPNLSLVKEDFDFGWMDD